MVMNRKRLLVSFTDEERVQVQALADQVRLSVSELLRRLVLGQRLPDAGQFVAAQTIRDLLKVNADQARLGNLLKMALDDADGDFPPATVARIEGLISKIHAAQADLKQTVAEIHYQAHPRAKRG